MMNGTSRGDDCSLRGRRILVTGGNGFLGCHLLTWARQQGAEAFTLDRKDTRKRGSKLRSSLGCGDVTEFAVDSFDDAEIAHVVRTVGPEIVFHLAGETTRDMSPESWLRCTEANVQLTASVIAAVTSSSKARRPVVIVPGTQMEYGAAPMPWNERQTPQPTNPYGATKLAATELLQAAVRRGEVRGCAVRLAIVFGPGQRPTMLIPEVITKTLTGVPVPVTEGTQQRRFVFARDAVAFLGRVGRKIADSDRMPPLLNAPAYEPIRIADVAMTLAAKIETATVVIGSLPARESELRDRWPDTGLADAMKLLRLTPFEQALDQTIAWYRSNRWFFPASAGSGRSQDKENPSPDLV